MKITIDVDITPRELRTFFGLPDVKPLQDEMLDRIRDKMRKGAEGFDPVTLLKPLMPQGMQSIEALQTAFWQAFTGKRSTFSDNDTQSKPSEDGKQTSGESAKTGAGD
ncbi:MAG: DUF6489 family protein [Gammaproteobacteria bacterium]|jgi:hypothetical protein